MLIACRAMLLIGLRIVKWIRRVKWESQGTSNLEDIQAPIIFASNHQSHVDTHVILDSLPKNIRKQTAVAAAFDHFADSDGTSRKKRCIQFLVAAVWHAFGIERVRSPLTSIRTMQNLLKLGWSIVIYPEGTRSRSGEINEFKAGLALVAKKSGCGVIPVYVNGGMKVLPEATYVPFTGKITISFGKQLHFKEGENNSDFMARVEAEVRSLASKQ
ncbi:MAG: 1-acyl-sn-glycerol-3-phosphate acyltransferase [Phycisphaerae bacterium]|nr:1-acyl-sn-glycerol-3-phosphate acyltransferase [Phycisphaerae bacterium]